ncbi:aromatic prenyltransferase [Penicillium brevicompactum]|uniref:Aromatic prenyltransferase n=1 Tax=Penicillium brevicompactum TaxID=5074 RepID=A0A9W9R6D3_PENBR|nr:aromatic prenyltransferase [Penicillium brevicompactum]
MDQDTEQPEPWESLARGLGFSEPDEEYWWTVFAQPLNQLMQWANYSTAEQYRVLAFLHRYIIPSCGPKPDENGQQFWKAFMTFDHTPIEISINFYNNKATVRATNIPVSRSSGSELDPLNQNASINALYAQKHLTPGPDPRWFEHFTNAFFIPDDEANVLNAEMLDRTFAAQALQCLLSYDFPYQKTQVKVDLCALWKGVQLNQPAHQLIFQSIRDLGAEVDSYMKSLDVLTDFIDSGDANTVGTGAMFFAFDANLSDSYQSSRIKIYFATTHTAFNRMVEIFTLRGRLSGPEMDRAIQALRLLWSSVINTPTDLSDDDDISPPNPHCCASVLFNFEIWPGADAPIPKIYLPAAYYGKPDLDIAEGMDIFFKSQGWDQPFHSYKDNFMKAFVRGQKITCRHHDISFSYKGGAAYVTAYYKPELEAFANAATWAPKFYK